MDVPVSPYLDSYCDLPMSEKHESLNGRKHRISILDSFAYMTAIAIGCGILSLIEIANYRNVYYLFFGPLILCGALGSFVSHILFGRKNAWYGVLISWLFLLGGIFYFMVIVGNSAAGL